MRDSTAYRHVMLPRFRFDNEEEIEDQWKRINPTCVSGNAFGEILEDILKEKEKMKNEGICIVENVKCKAHYYQAEIDRQDGVTFHLDNLIEKVIFNEPATIVIWKDGTKSVVKVQEGEEFNPYIGLAMCISKKAMGNQGNYFNVFKKWCEPYAEEHNTVTFAVTDIFGNLLRVVNLHEEKEKSYE